MSFTIIGGVTIKCLQKHKLDFASFFFPSGAPLVLAPLLVPIETVSKWVITLFCANHVMFTCRSVALAWLALGALNTVRFRVKVCCHVRYRRIVWSHLFNSQLCIA